jgi:hypothetical protein
MDLSTEYEVILLTSEGTNVRCKSEAIALEGIFCQRVSEFGGWKKVPQRLKPGLAVLCTARLLKPCPSRNTELSRRL